MCVSFECLLIYSTIFKRVFWGLSQNLGRGGKEHGTQLEYDDDFSKIKKETSTKMYTPF